jgi:hypothetical protein
VDIDNARGGGLVIAPKKKKGKTEITPRGKAPSPLQPDETLDLHGMALDEAEAAVEFLLDRMRGRKTLLLLIHGRSQTGPQSIRGRLQLHLKGKWKSRVNRVRNDYLNPGATWVETTG